MKKVRKSKHNESIDSRLFIYLSNPLLAASLKEQKGKTERSLKINFMQNQFLALSLEKI